MRRLFDVDPDQGTREYFHYNDDDDTFTIETVEDVQDVVDINKEQYKESGGRWGDLNLVARIPPVIWTMLEKSGLARDNKALLRWIDDSDQRAFKTRPGRLS